MKGANYAPSGAKYAPSGAYENKLCCATPFWGDFIYIVTLFICFIDFVGYIQENVAPLPRFFQKRGSSNQFSCIYPWKRNKRLFLVYHQLAPKPDWTYNVRKYTLKRKSKGADAP